MKTIVCVYHDDNVVFLSPGKILQVVEHTEITIYSKKPRTCINCTSIHFVSIFGIINTNALEIFDF